ncbi:uncharacterized protein N7515_010076 [Penicillium bovifimosum]|uniref:Defective in cullin neddylation protein n=1 Tax=Penicillium bovifimosum TaxID=126998 RepID=A0A9W9GHU5_9EURO|nr:uncharacterized protein N7515_010076 [Penicillium bovifimosum]KAJ5120688.1 hypothetical protein N7515_010076 [Penicillium bovifimosum]
MAPYTAAQKKLIAEFIEVTRTKDTVAPKFLKASGWKLEQAIVDYLAAAKSTQHVYTSPITILFESYRDDPVESPDTIGITRAIDFLRDINVELDEVACLAVSEQLKCPSIGEITRDGFVLGWINAGCDTIPLMQEWVKKVRTRIPKDPQLFRKVYRYAFTVSRMQGQRHLQFDIAVEQWRLFFTAERGGLAWNTKTTPWLDWWIQYLEDFGSKPVTKDLWEQVEVFMRKTLEDEDMHWYNPDGAWPGALDDFVGWVQDERHEPKMGKGQEQDMEVE